MKDLDFKKYKILFNMRENDLMHTLSNLRKEELTEEQVQITMRFFSDMKKDINDFIKEKEWNTLF